MNSIVLIGAGNIGSRHLQSLATLGLDWEITVIEPNLKSMLLAQSRYKKVMLTHSPRPIYCNSLDNMPKSADIFILATPAAERLDLIQKALSYSECHNLILEKVVFQSVEDFKIAEDLFDKNNIDVWVNCPRRQWPVFIQLKNTLTGSTKIECHFSRSQFAMTCNSIHLIDIFQFLTGVDEVLVDGSGLSNPVINDKKAGYIDFTGVLKVTNNRGDLFTISGYETANVIPPLMTVISDKQRWIFEQQTESLSVANPATGWKWQKSPISTPHQSTLTSTVIRQIISNKTCNLTKFSTAKRAHVPMLKAFLDRIETATGNRPERCHIT